MIVDIVGSEAAWEAAAEYFVEMFACVGEVVGAREHERIVGDVDYAFE